MTKVQEEMKLGFDDGTEFPCTDRAWSFAERIPIDTTVKINTNKDGIITLVHDANFTPKLKKQWGGGGSTNQQLITDTTTNDKLEFILTKIQGLEDRIEEISNKIDAKVVNVTNEV